MKTKNGTELNIISLKGKPYLPVQGRVLWFTEETERYEIKTEFLHLDDKKAICRATVIVFFENGTIQRQVTSTKTETVDGFGDFAEKAETGSIGRALALLGFGTQFALELDEGERIVDSPVMKQTAPQPRETVLTPKKSVESDPNPGEMAVPFGAQKGKLIRMLNEKELQNNIDFWSRAESEKPLGPGPAKYLANLRAYQKTPKADPTFFEDDKL